MGTERAVKRAVAAALLLLLLAGAAQARWSDVAFRNLTATPSGNDTYRFSVLAANGAAGHNANNVSFELRGPTGPAYLCPRYLNLTAFERRTVECLSPPIRPARYILIFQGERIVFDAVGGLAPPPPTAPPPSPVPSSGFEAAGALAALLLLSLCGRGGRRS